MTDKEILGIIEAVAAFHLIISGIFLLLKKTKSKKAFLSLAFFLIILGVHFSLLFLDMLLGVGIPSIVSSAFLFSYGPLLYSFSKAYAKQESVLKKDILYSLLPFVYLTFWSLFLYKENASFFEDNVSVPIYASNFLFTGYAIYIGINSSLKPIEKKFIAFISGCFFAMLLIFFSMSIFLELGYTNIYMPFKLAFLAILLLLAEGLMIIFIKFPQVLVNTKDLRLKIKRYEAPLYDSLNKGYDEKVIRALQSYVLERENYRENLRLNDVSESIGFPSYDLSKAISRQLQMNFNQYINQIRINKSAELLRDPKFKISEVMNQVGFNSKSRFFHVFQEKFGTTPRNFQRNSQ